MFQNVSDRYGGPEFVTMDDYRDLNPEGDFSMSLQTRDGQLIDVIIEHVDGQYEVIAEAV